MGIAAACRSPLARASAAIAVVLALGPPPAAAADAKPGKDGGDEEALPTWYAQALARGPAGLNVTHFWSKGAKLRSESVIAGHKVVTVVNGQWYYAYDGLTNQGLAIKRQPEAVARDRPDRRPFGDELEILKGQGAEKVREEEVLGRRTGVYRVTDEHGRRELWVTLDEEHIPLRLEIYDRQTATKRYTDYVNWQSDLYIPDSFFEPDRDAKLEKLGFEEYLRRTLEEGSVGPVPVLYTDLLYKRPAQ